MCCIFKTIIGRILNQGASKQKTSQKKPTDIILISDLFAPRSISDIFLVSRSLNVF